MNDTPEENKAAQHIEEMHEFIADNQRLIDDHMRDVERELAAAIAQRDKARNDALEEAAKICEEYANVGVVGARICAAAICATKGAHIKEMHQFIAENQRLIKLSEGITQNVITGEKP